MRTKEQHNAYQRECRRQKRDKEHFGGNRLLAIQRDGERCVQCGMTRAEHRARFLNDITVDHIDGRGRGVPNGQQNNDLSNLQTLCLICHGNKDHKQKTRNVRPSIQRGEACTFARLTTAQVQEIRQCYAAGGVTHRALSQRFGVGETQIRRVVKRQQWSHVA